MSKRKTATWRPAQQQFPRLTKVAPDSIIFHENPSIERVSNPVLLAFWDYEFSCQQQLDQAHAHLDARLLPFGRPAKSVCRVDVAVLVQYSGSPATFHWQTEGHDDLWDRVAFWAALPKPPRSARQEPEAESWQATVSAWDQPFITELALPAVAVIADGFRYERYESQGPHRNP